MKGCLQKPTTTVSPENSMFQTTYLDLKICLWICPNSLLQICKRNAEGKSQDHVPDAMSPQSAEV